MSPRAARKIDSPRLLEVLTLLGPDFRPVSSEEIAHARGIKVKSAAKLASQLVQGSPDWGIAPMGGVGCARKLRGHLWAITDRGQEMLMLEPGADRAYMEWLAVTADDLHGSQNEAYFALQALEHVSWRTLEALSSLSGEEIQDLALHVMGAIARSPVAFRPKSPVRALRVFREAGFCIVTKERAKQARKLQVLLEAELTRARQDLDSKNVRSMMQWLYMHLDRLT